MSRARVVVTGMGVLAPLGVDVPSFWRAISAGTHAIAPVARYPLDGFSVRLAASVPDGTHTERFTRPPRESDTDPSEDYALHAAREALASSELLTRVPPERVGLVLGTSAGPLWSRSVYELASDQSPGFLHAFFQKLMLHGATARVAAALGLRGPTLTVSTACTSSAMAVVHGCQWLEQGHCDAVLAGGVDVLLMETLGGFHAMGAMCPVPCAPFSEPAGMTVGEGAGFVVLERGDAVGARVRGVIAGWGAAVDGYHATAPDPSGSGVARATALALADAGISAADVGYVNAHGTGTDANDAAEVRGLRKALGARADAVPVSSTKSYFGHTLGAAGALELITTLLAMEHGVVPPTLNFTRPRGGAPADPVAETAPRTHSYDAALSVNAGFGGHNAALVALAPSGVSRPIATAADARRCYLAGAGVLAAHGDGLDGFDAALRRGESLARPVPPSTAPRPRPALASLLADPDPERFARGVDARGLDHAARALLAATASALASAGIKPRGAARDRTALYAVLSGVSPDSESAFWGSVRERGYARLSAPAFARIVTNTPAGSVARALSLFGAGSVALGRSGASLAALGLAAHAVERNRGADAAVLATVALVSDDMLMDRAFETPPGSREESLRTPVGAAAAGFALGAAGSIRVAGCSHAGPEGLSRAILDALSRAQIDRAGISLVYRAGGPGTEGDELERAGLEGVFGAELARVRVCEPARVFGDTDASDAIALLAAREALVRRAPHAGAGPLNIPVPRSALVVSARRDEGAHAVVLTRDGD